ncbi:MAG: F0F1 ATP synthase subunit B [Sulfurovum sp.]|nr:F0F1 ATP synthase subunit B [Sulfurovum sp.]MCB4772301.1 F0F1 ATP synthase subunit B [Sulfurovum sp.]
MKRLLWISLLFLPLLLLASNGNGGEVNHYLAQTGRENDFWPRVINFTIFAVLLWYLVASPIKDFFIGRSERIASQLKETEEKLQVAKEEKKEAQARLKESIKKADQIIKDAKKETLILAKKIAEANKQELEAIQKQFEEKIVFEERKATREVIDEVLSENITIDDIVLDEAKVIHIISGKVA